MRRGCAAAACLVVSLCLPQSAAAEWQFTPMFGGMFRGDTSLLDLESATDNRHQTFGAAVSLLGSGIFGAELFGLYTPGFFEGDPALVDVPEFDFVESSRTYALMGNVVITAPRRWTEYSLRPFVSGGFGLLNAKQLSVSNTFPFSTNMAGYNIGGGAVGFLTSRTGLRFDLRYFSTLRREGDDALLPSFGRVHLRYMTATIGIVIRR